MPQEEKRVLTVVKYEYGILIHALNDMRTDLIEEERPTDAVDELLLKTIDAPKKKRGKGDVETR
jgi:hypothetical protein